MLKILDERIDNVNAATKSYTVKLLRCCDPDTKIIRRVQILLDTGDLNPGRRLSGRHVTLTTKQQARILEIVRAEHITNTRILLAPINHQYQFIGH